MGHWVHLVRGGASDAGTGRLLLDTHHRADKGTRRGGAVFLVMDRAYEGWETRWLAFEWGYTAVVPPKKNRKDRWEYDKELYKQR
ncbi:MAG: hypothetical protein LBP20_01120, partial [Treponema sp.]|nr:hypothetical protein [Treponema sp.]